MHIEKPRFESSAHGKIQQVFLTIPSWILRYEHQVEIHDTAAAYKGLLSAFDESVEFLIVTHREAESYLGAWLKDSCTIERSTVVYMPNDSALNVWAQDAFVKCVDKSKNQWLLQPDDSNHPIIDEISRLVAEQLGIQRHLVNSRFQSGNVLVGDNFWLLGIDSAPEDSRLDIGASRASAQSSNFEIRSEGWVFDCEKTLHIVGSRITVPGFPENAHVQETLVNGTAWHEVIYRGNRLNTRQPVFHIDAFVTLAGRDDDGRYKVLVGDPQYAASELSMHIPDHALVDVFDDIVDQLSDSGFNVVRNPLPLIYYDNHITLTRYWYFATYNNALVEITESERNVWLPTYGHGRWQSLARFDALNEEIWRKLGFTTKLLGNHHQFAMNLGATHCIAKCLSRLP